MLFFQVIQHGRTFSFCLSWFLFLADINECATNKAGCHHVCINTQGSYYCACTDGYWLYSQNFTDLVKIPNLKSPILRNNGYIPKHDCISK